VLNTLYIIGIDMRERAPQFTGKTYGFSLEQPKIYHLPNWDGYKDPKKLQIMREIVLQYGRDPRVAQLAVKILRECGCKPREYRKQASCLLKWVQKNIYYVNEPGERLQSPLYTLKSGMGDCDDLSILLCAFFECIRLPWKFVITAYTRSGLVRYVEGDANYKRLPYSHIYCCVGNQPFKPSSWEFCEPTMDVPLGWDIVKAQTDPEARRYMPELGSVGRPSVIGPTVGGSVGEAIMENNSKAKDFFKTIGFAILTGALVGAGTEILLDYLRASKIYKALVLKER